MKAKQSTMKSAFLGKFVIVRTFSAGVHAGILMKKKCKEVLLSDSVRLWSWTQPKTNTGSLSAVSQYGVGPGSKIANAVPFIELTEAIEVIPCSPAAIESLKVASWS